MRAKRELEEGLRLLRRERGKLAALSRAFEASMLGDEAHHAEVEEVAKLDIKATFMEPIPKSVRKALIPNWAWRMHYRR